MALTCLRIFPGACLRPDLAAAGLSVVGSGVRGMGDGGRGEREPFDGGGDVAPEFVAAAFAQLDAALEVLQGLAWSPLSAGEVRATVRGLTARQSRLASAGFGGLVAILPGRVRGRRRWRSRSMPWVSTTPPRGG